MKKFLCILLAAVMLVSLVPFSALASGKTETVNGSMTFDINKSYDDFNKYTVKYSSDTPLKATVRFNRGSEDFFLEAGDDITFSSFIDGFTSNDLKNEIKSITVSLIKGNTAKFALHSVETEKADVPGKTIYIESDRYKVGINLLWGGGISYIEDLKDGNKKLGNLLNAHDTGRLVQQSYYGTASAPYECGSYNGTTWPYNPVQGGNLYNEPSKIIDYRISDGEIYVKSRARDWAKHEFTDTYYENTYTIDGDVIRVNNVMKDYSPYSHRLSSQEIPAFYVVSHLNTFVYYNGTSPWTGDELTVEKNLGFWGENKGTYVNILPENTETWSAWVNDDGYGLGLYTPGTQNYTAGRYQYNGSTSPTNGATNYVAPVVTLRMPFAAPLEYDYIISAGTVEEIRDNFTENKEFTDNKTLFPGAGLDDYSVLRFGTGQQDSFLTGQYQCTSYSDPVKTVLTATIEEVNDPYLTLDLTGSGISADENTHIFVVYNVPEENAETAYLTELFLCAGSTMNAEAGKSVTFPSSPSDGIDYAVIDLSNRAFWKGNVNSIRIDFFSGCTAGDIMNLYAIGFAQDGESAEELAKKVVSEMEALEAPTDSTEETEPPATDTEAESTKGDITESQSGTEEESTSAADTDKSEKGGIDAGVIIAVCAAAVVLTAVAVVIVIKKKKNG